MEMPHANEAQPPDEAGEARPEVPIAERIAREFHDSYERLAPDFGYETREKSAVPWDEVPDSNRGLMIATVTDLLERRHIAPGQPTVNDFEVAKYLDDSIRFWRGVRDGTQETLPPLTADEGREKAPLYIDAFQSARVSLLGRQLP